MFLNRFSFLEIAKTFVDSELGVSGHSGVTGSGGSIVLDQHWQWISIGKLNWPECCITSVETTCSYQSFRVADLE